MVEKKKTAKKLRQNGELAALQNEAELLTREIAEAPPDRRPLGFRLDNPAPEQDIGQRVHDARRQAGMTQKDLAERTKLLDEDGQGVSRGALSLYEIGKNYPPPKELRLLCEALKVSPNRLIYGVEDPFDDLEEGARYRFGAVDGPHLYAQMIYRLSKLHHHHRLSLLKLMDGLLYADNRRFEADEASFAEDEFLRMADELKANRSKLP